MLRRRARFLGLGLMLVLLGVALCAHWLTPQTGSRLLALQAGLGSAGAREVVAWWLPATRNVAWLVLGISAVAAALGTALGVLSSYGGGAGRLLSRSIEISAAVPALILVGVLRFADPSGGTASLFGTLALLRTLDIAQLVRVQVMRTLPSDFGEASRALGASRRWQWRVHVLPRLLGPLSANLLTGAASLIGLEAALTFTGLGLPLDVPSWGGGLSAIASGGSGLSWSCVVGSIALTSAVSYWLGLHLSVDTLDPRLAR
jgi:ABC-type dipeptide/oligopeptide/nickel transport system permease subunit